MRDKRQHRSLRDYVSDQPTLERYRGGGDYRQPWGLDWSKGNTVTLNVGHRHGGGGGFHGGGRGRRFFGGWGGGPYWYDPYWYGGDPVDVNVNIYEGANMNSSDPWQSMQSAPPAWAMQVPPPYVGADLMGADADLTKVLAPVVCPTQGMTARLELRGRTLYATICAQGQEYASSMDVGPLIDGTLAQFKAFHDDLHAQKLAEGAGGANPQVSGEFAVGAAQNVVWLAGQKMVQGLADQYVGAVCGAWLDTVSAGFWDSIVHTLRKFKGPIAVAAGAAATAGAVAIPGVGPFVAPLAGTAATALTSAAIGDDEAKAKVADMKQQAASNPAVAQALDLAHKAVAQTTAAYHTVDTMNKAAAGDASAQQTVNKIDADAAKGDPVAQWAQNLAQKAMGSLLSDAPADIQQATTEAVSSGVLPPLVLLTAAGLAGYMWWSNRRAKAAAKAAMAAAAKADMTSDPAAKTTAAQEAAAHVETAQASSPPLPPAADPLTSPQFGAPEPAPMDPGLPPPAAAPLTGPQFGPNQAPLAGPPMAPPAPPMTGYDVVGAAIDTIRAEASNIARQQSDRVVGVMRKPNGNYVIMSFATADDADDWFGRQDASEYVYIAYYDKGDPAWPLNEQIGHGGATPAASGWSFNPFDVAKTIAAPGFAFAEHATNYATNFFGGGGGGDSRAARRAASRYRHPRHRRYY